MVVSPIGATTLRARAGAGAEAVFAHPRLQPRRLLGTAVPGSLVLGFLGLLEYEGVPHMFVFDLDSEWVVPAVWSFALLALAGVLALLAARRDRSTAASALGCGLLFMSADELTSIHETLERVTGVDWEVLYLPVFMLLAAAFAALMVRLRRDRADLARMLLLAGAAAWAISQCLEKLQWDGARQRPGYIPMATSEEVLEMIGSALFAAGIVAWQRRRRAEPPSLAVAPPGS